MTPGTACSALAEIGCNEEQTCFAPLCNFQQTEKTPQPHNMAYLPHVVGARYGAGESLSGLSLRGWVAAVNSRSAFTIDPKVLCA